MRKHFLKVKTNKEIADKIFEIQLESESKLEDFMPGNFLHIKCNDGYDPLLRRPMSICDISDDKKLLTVLYRADGRGTVFLSHKEAGEIIDVLAPLGNFFPFDKLNKDQTIALVGGGIGVPPLYYLGKTLQKAFGVKIKSYLGFNSKKDVFYEKEFSKLGDTIITTMDGSHGKKGLIPDFIDEGWDFIYSCGPNLMFKSLQKKFPTIKENVFISVEERMGCGVGACLACVCKTNPDSGFEKSWVRACTEGPIFQLHDLEFS